MKKKSRKRPAETNPSQTVKPAKKAKADGTRGDGHMKPQRTTRTAADKLQILMYRYGTLDTPVDDYPHSFSATRDAFGVDKRQLKRWKNQ